MAPIPENDQPTSQPDPASDRKPWTTSTIVMGAVFLFLLVAFIIALVVFVFHKRALRKKMPPETRSKPYRPFRTESTDKSRLLENAAALSPDEERSSMYSRERGSVSLYVDADPMVKRTSMETVSLIPLQVTPAPEERQESLTGNISNGSGVSAGSSRYTSSSRYSRSSAGLSPLSPEQDEGDLGSRRTRPRSTSTSSVRYYATTPTSEKPPEIPKIVHTVSD